MFKKPSEKQNNTPEFEEKILERINSLTQKFLGTKNFHNYSRKMKAKSPQSKRYVIEFGAKILAIEEILSEEKLKEYTQENLKGFKYLLFKIKGQSFIYHQIRKMIGVLVQIFQKDFPDVYIENSLTNNVVPVWLAPAEGLFLNRVNEGKIFCQFYFFEQVSFESYNAKKDIPELMEITEEEVINYDIFKQYFLGKNY